MSKLKKYSPYIKLKHELSRKKISYLEVAILLGKSVRTISMKINGYSDFYISEQQKICDAFGIRQEVFF